jgi:hypothetical protein
MKTVGERSRARFFVVSFGNIKELAILSDLLSAFGF